MTPIATLRKHGGRFVAPHRNQILIIPLGFSAKSKISENNPWDITSYRCAAIMLSDRSPDRESLASAFAQVLEHVKSQPHF